MSPERVEVSVSEFVALLNQTLEYAYHDIVIIGELANLRVSKNRWVYFDLKDDDSSVKFFGTVYQLPGPLEDGMILKVRGQPKLHQLYGFSVNVASIQPAGEGTIKRAAELLQAKLQTEGLFDPIRKRMVPYPPQRIGLIASKQSAAYADFIKILNARWRGLELLHIDVQVQGDIAPSQIIAAFDQFNSLAEPPEVIVVIRGGGSPEDLAAFSTEQVTRAVAGSRVPTVVAIGHEVDVSLAELAADIQASTPSNAAELLVPDRAHVASQLAANGGYLEELLLRTISKATQRLDDNKQVLQQRMKHHLVIAQQTQLAQVQLLQALSPEAILRRGYAIVRAEGKPVRAAKQLTKNAIVQIEFADSQAEATITDVNKKGNYGSA